MNLGDFLSPEAGQRRTRALHEFINKEVGQFVPPNLREALGLAAQANPVNDIYEAGGNMRDGDYIGAATNTAAAALPLAGAVTAKPLAKGIAQGSDDASRSIVDALTTYQAGAGDAARRFALDEAGSVGRGKGIRAYHGSPHDFDRFSMDKIGTGEGAQAYGHGLYFAESEDVARSYRDTLAQRVDVDGQPLLLNNKQVGTTGDDQLDDLIIAHNGNIEAAIADERAFADQMAAAGKTSRRYGGDPYTGVRKLEALRDRVQSTNSGRMYEVRINADPDDFLDWDAPLSEQPQGVRSLADAQGVADVAPEWRFNGYDGGYFRNTENGAKRIGRVRHLGGDQYKAQVGNDDLGSFSSPELARAAIDRAIIDRGGAGSVLQMRGSDVYDRLSGGVDSLVHSSPRRVDATKAMQDAGIPGIRYRDAMSRDGTDGGTRNYVVFDENLIEIVRKYGIAGAAAMLGVNEMDVQSALGQGPMGDYLEQ